MKESKIKCHEPSTRSWSYRYTVARLRGEEYYIFSSATMFRGQPQTYTVYFAFCPRTQQIKRIDPAWCQFVRYERHKEGELLKWFSMEYSEGSF